MTIAMNRCGGVDTPFGGCARPRGIAAAAGNAMYVDQPVSEIVHAHRDPSPLSPSPEWARSIRGII